MMLKRIELFRFSLKLKLTSLNLWVFMFPFWIESFYYFFNFIRILDIEKT
jgi:hypothetical protein